MVGPEARLVENPCFRVRCVGGKKIMIWLWFIILSYSHWITLVGPVYIQQSSMPKRTSSADYLIDQWPCFSISWFSKMRAQGLIGLKLWLSSSGSMRQPFTHWLTSAESCESQRRAEEHSSLTPIVNTRSWRIIKATLEENKCCIA